MGPLLESLGFGLAMGFMFLGLVGVIVPLLPGILLVWLTLLVYAVLTGFEAISLGLFAFLTVVALVTGTGELWLPLLGARTTGARWQSMLLAAAGSLVGLVIANLIGAIVGHALGIIVGEYRRHGDWNLALKASLGGLAGWGVATVVQLGGALLIMFVFAWRVLVGG